MWAPRVSCRLLFFFNDTATTEIYTLSLHDALPIYVDGQVLDEGCARGGGRGIAIAGQVDLDGVIAGGRLGKGDAGGEGSGCRGDGGRGAKRLLRGAILADRDEDERGAQF